LIRESSFLEELLWSLLSKVNSNEVKESLGNFFILFALLVAFSEIGGLHTCRLDDTFLARLRYIQFEHFLCM
jgi:hypothetical protein